MDREQLHTARQRLADLNQELHTLKQELDTSMAQPESRPARTYKLMHKRPRVLPTQLTTNSRGAPQPSATKAQISHHEAGYSIER